MPKIVTHYDYGGLPLCDTAHKAPQLVEREENVTCAKCLDRFNRSEDVRTSMPDSCAGPNREIVIGAFRLGYPDKEST